MKKQKMLTINYVIEKNFTLQYVLSDEDKKAILKENEKGDPSYLRLMEEMFKTVTTVHTLIKGWGGITLISIENGGLEG